ncbi:MAG: UpxY family transcription antiterminator [Sedimentisphaerales bacterium]|nr:UpxY family transcription antiterminator [Sedimentisphaerales bacterium]
MLKPSENPPVIWPAEKSVKDFEGTWWVAHTKSRNEKALAWQLNRKDISYFLPMSWKVSQSKGRVIRSLLPVFSCYLFFCGSEDDRLEVLRTNRVANLIEVKDQQHIVSDLWPIEVAIRKGEMLRPEAYIKEGQRCRVIAGPLIGMEGIVLKTRHRYRLVLQVVTLGQATSVEIDSDMLELLDK